MSIKYNERGEVVSVNGLTTGHHVGSPMQDYIAEKPEDNHAYCEEMRTLARCNVENDELQPVIPGGTGGAEIKTCNVRIIPFGDGDSENMFAPAVACPWNGMRHYTKCENGVVSSVFVENYSEGFEDGETTEYDVLLENVVCGSVFFLDAYPSEVNTEDGYDLQQNYYKEYIFVAPTVPNVTAVLKLGAEGDGDW